VPYQKPVGTAAVRINAEERLTGASLSTIVQERSERMSCEAHFEKESFPTSRRG
jgi:hypothetical protein